MGLNRGDSMNQWMLRSIMLIMTVTTISILFGVDYVLLQVLITGSSNLGIIFMVPTMLFLVLMEIITFIIYISQLREKDILERAGKAYKFLIFLVTAIAIIAMLYIDIDMLGEFSSLVIPVTAPSIVMDKSVGMGIAFYNGGLAIMIFALTQLYRNSIPLPIIINRYSDDNDKPEIDEI